MDKVALAKGEVLLAAELGSPICPPLRRGRKRRLHVAGVGGIELAFEGGAPRRGGCLRLCRRCVIGIGKCDVGGDEGDGCGGEDGTETHGFLLWLGGSRPTEGGSRPARSAADSRP